MTYIKKIDMSGVPRSVRPGSLEAEEIHSFWHELDTHRNAINKGIESLFKLVSSRAEQHRTIQILNPDGAVLATIQDGLWIEEDILLSEWVYNHLIETNTPDNQRYNYPETIRRIACGEGKDLVREVKAKIEHRKAETMSRRPGPYNFEHGDKKP
jgi:hypothetical protein